MELKWSLKELYKSFESNEFESDLEKVDNLIGKINDWALEIVKNTEEPIRKLEEYINLYTELEDLTSRVGAFIHLTISADTTNSIALKYSDVLDDKLTKIVETDTKLEKWISSLENLNEVIEASDKLKEHKFILTSIVEKSKYLLSDKEESIIANMQNTGSNSWLKLKNNLISNHKVAIEEEGQVKEVPLTVALNMAYDKDKDIRKKAYLAEIESYKKIEDGVAAALNAIKGEVLTICKLRGYTSPLEQTLVNSRMDKESLDAMLEAMREAMPTFRKYLRRKAEILGYNNGLPFYEMYAPIIDKDMEFSYEEGAKFVEKNFRKFSNHLADFARKAVDNSWIDVYPREAKVGGAFCSNLHFIGESRFLLNYGNSFSDVVTMAHELGHGFHGECLKNETALNSHYPMPIAETASTFCETIIKKAAIKEADKEEALSILESEISDSTQVIVDIYSRFLFESWFFEKRKESSLSVEEIKELMINAQKEAYGDGLDPEYVHPYMWTWKPHYYYVNSNFYNFPYAFGLLFAKGLYAEYIRRGDSFPQDYENLLSITGKNKIADVTKVMGIDIHNKDFWRSSLKTIEEDIEKFIELSKEITK